MEWLIVLVVVLAVCAVLGARLKSEGINAYPYKAQPSLFSAAERSFFGVIEQAVGDEIRVFGKVRVADVAGVKSISDRGAWQRAFNKINAKHFDFVLCRKNDLSIVAVIELDDKSHKKRERRERDEFLAGLCNAIGLPLIRVPAQTTYSLADLRATVHSALQGYGATASASPRAAE